MLAARRTPSSETAGLLLLFRPESLAGRLPHQERKPARNAMHFEGEAYCHCRNPAAATVWTVDPIPLFARSCRMTIPRPKTTPVDPDHVLDAEFALEPYFQELAEKAKAAGWDEGVVAMALVGLAEAHLHMRKANSATDLAISFARATRQQ